MQSTKFILVIFLIFLVTMPFSIITGSDNPRKWSVIDDIDKYVYPTPNFETLKTTDPTFGAYLTGTKKFHLRDAQTAELLFVCDLPEMNEKPRYCPPIITENGVAFQRCAVNSENETEYFFASFDGSEKKYNLCIDGLVSWQKKPISIIFDKTDETDIKLVAKYIEDCSIIWEKSFKDLSVKYRFININNQYIYLHPLESSQPMILNVNTGELKFSPTEKMKELVGIGDNLLIFYDDRRSPYFISVISMDTWNVALEKTLETKTDYKKFISRIVGDEVYFVHQLNEVDTYDTECLCKVERFNPSKDTIIEYYFKIPMNEFWYEKYIYHTVRDFYDNLVMTALGDNITIIDMINNRIIWEVSGDIFLPGMNRYPRFKEDGIIVYTTTNHVQAFDINKMKHLWKLECSNFVETFEHDNLVYSGIREIKDGEYGMRINVFNKTTEMYEPYSYYIPNMYILSEEHYFVKYGPTSHYCPSKFGILCLPLGQNNKFILFKAGISESFYEIISPFSKDFQIDDWEYTDDDKIILLKTKKRDRGGEWGNSSDFYFNIPDGKLVENNESERSDK